MIGTITLNPSIDQRWLLDGLVKDDANRAKGVNETAGGKGINVSKVVRELGGKTRAYALLGGLTGDLLKELAKPLDFPIHAIQIHGKTRMNTILTDLKDKTHTRISAPGPKVSSFHLERFVKLLLASKPKPSFWVFGGSLPQGLPESSYRDLIGVLQKNGIPCVLDADDRALRLGLEAKPFMIKPNEFEMRRLCGKKLSTIKEYHQEASKIVQQGIRLVIVSLAARGAIFVTADRSFYIHSPHVVVKNYLGAGDSLIGGMVFGLETGLSFEEAAKNGIAASTSAVMRQAPRLCQKEDMSGILKRLKIVYLDAPSKGRYNEKLDFKRFE